MLLRKIFITHTLFKIKKLQINLIYVIRLKVRTREMIWKQFVFPDVFLLAWEEIFTRWRCHKYIIYLYVCMYKLRFPDLAITLNYAELRNFALLKIAISRVRSHYT